MPFRSPPFPAFFPLALVACTAVTPGEDFGEVPDLVRVEDRFERPAGVLARGRELETLERYSKVRSQAEMILPSSAASDGSPAPGAARRSRVSIADVAEVTPSRTSCEALQHRDARGTCACQNGGVFVYDFRELAEARRGERTEAVLKLKLEQCAVGDTVLEGVQFLRLAGEGENATRTLDAELLAQDERNLVRLAVAMKDDGSNWWLEVEGPEGPVVVSGDWDAGASSGHVSIRDREGTWNCTLERTRGGCTNERGDVRLIGAPELPTTTAPIP